MPLQVLQIVVVRDHDMDGAEAEPSPTDHIGDSPVRYFISATLQRRSFMRMLGRAKRLVS